MSDQTQKRISIEQQNLAVVIESIRDVYELSTRIDERLQSVMKKQDELEVKMEATISQTNTLASKIMLLENLIKTNEGTSENASEEISKIKDSIHALEMKLQTVEHDNSQHKDIWGKILEVVMQVGVLVLAAWLLVKFGVSAN